MTFFADLTPYAYNNTEPDPAVLNIGWLSADYVFPKYTPDPEFLSALCRIAQTPVNLYRGKHACEFCPAPEFRLTPNGLRLAHSQPGTTGNGEIRVEGLSGVIYVAPALIVHYVADHHYAPPQEFVEAVLAAP